MKWDPTLFSSPDGLDPEKYIIATYFVTMPRTVDVLKYAAALAIEQSTGTWTRVPHETFEVREKYAAKVVGVYEVPSYEIELPEDVKTRHFVIQIAFPWINFGHNLSMLLSTITGNIMYFKLKCLDMMFPKSFVEGFKGPKFGISGLRKMLKIPKRPLTNTMVKPCTGITPEVVGKIIYEAAAGGIDIVKDDELQMDAKFCPFENRLAEGMEAIDKAAEVTGKKSIYFINVTDKPDVMLERAEKAVQSGANGIMVNHFTTGIGALQMVTEDPSIKVPVLGHLDYGGAMTAQEYTGVNSHILHAKFPRLVGADVEIFPSPHGKFEILTERSILMAHHCRVPLYHIKRTLPGPGGGVHAGIVPELIDEFGFDFLVAAGGAVHAHPMGGTAGAKALLQAIDAVMNGIDLIEYAEQHKELKVAIDKWGAGKAQKLG